MQTVSRRELHKLTRKKPEAAREEAGKGCPDPLGVLRITRDKARHVLELNMGGRQIRELHSNLLYFSNTEVLWLNDNCLTEIRGLLCEDTGRVSVTSNEGALGLRRLKRLYLSNNSIATLDGDIKRLRYLEVLLLANNQLRNMDIICQMLTQLKSLKQLDLFENPLAEEANYRLYLIYHIPSLEIFDRQAVTIKERSQANALYNTAARAASNFAFGSTAPVQCNAVTIDFMEKRWRRIWHQVKGNKGAFDLRCSQIMDLASRGNQVHIRTAGLPSRSVTSNPDTYPIHQLRQGKAISFKNDGKPITKEDVAECWTGSKEYLDHLWNTVPKDSNLTLDRPLSRVLYWAPGNSKGLSLSCPSVGATGVCGWASDAPAAVEVYIDVGIEGDDKPSDVSLSVRHLQNKVFEIRTEDMNSQLRERDAQNLRAVNRSATKDMFHSTWGKRLGVENADKIPVREESAAAAQGKKDLAVALTMLKKDASEEKVNEHYKEIHKNEKHGCLFEKIHGGHVFGEAEPFVPERDTDCFKDKYETYLSDRREEIATKEEREAVSLCFTEAEKLSLGVSLGDGDIEGTVVMKESIEGMMDLCYGGMLDDGRVGVTLGVMEAFQDADSMPLLGVMAVLTKQKNFVTYKIEQLRLSAVSDISGGDTASAMDKHQKINKLTNLLTTKVSSPVGAAFAKHSHNLLPSKPEPTRPRAKVVDPADEFVAAPLTSPPAGINPHLGTVGTDVSCLIQTQTTRDFSKILLTASLCVVAVSCVRDYSVPPLGSRPPWG